jgi:hypothetical protein
MYKVDKFLGINEAIDGATELKLGQASRMENWLVTDGYNLTVRPGIRRISLGVDHPMGTILASWVGHVGKREYLVVADFHEGTDRLFLYGRGGGIGDYYLHCRQDGALGLTDRENAKVKIFDFGGALFVMSSGNTVVYRDGAFETANPYIPLVITGAAPTGGGTALEQINLLTPQRRIDFSADGNAKAFVLPEEAIGITAITVDNAQKEVSQAGSFDAGKHTFTFTAAPAKGVGNVEFTYTTDGIQAEENRMRIVNMTLVEAYNGATDTRLFMAGDGSNLCLYSGVPLSGDMTQLYFPAMNEVKVDMSGSPVTGIVRHYGKLVVFKPDGTYTITYEPVTLEDGNTIAGFYLRAANREFGNDVMGQVQTVSNYPRTISKGGIYEWRITSTYYRDERYAKRVSDAVERTLSLADLTGAVTCDDSYNKTYYIFLNDSQGTVLVNRYALGEDGGIWCVYRSNLCKGVKKAMMHGGPMVFATEQDLFYLDDSSRMDASQTPGGEEQAIRAVWESGYMDFGADFRQKYSSKIYIAMMPQSNSEMIVTASTDRRSSYIEKVVAANVSTWADMDFNHWAFDMTAAPRPKRVRLKVKKFTYYRLIFRVEKPGAVATVLGYDQEVRMGAMVK